jgi:hypothetical protein
MNKRVEGYSGGRVEVLTSNLATYKDGSEVAVKKLRAASWGSSREEKMLKKRFEREALISTVLVHPNTATTLAVSVEPPEICMGMSFLAITFFFGILAVHVYGIFVERISSAFFFMLTFMRVLTPFSFGSKVAFGPPQAQENSDVPKFNFHVCT